MLRRRSCKRFWCGRGPSGVGSGGVAARLLEGVRRVVVLIVDAFGWLQLHDELARQPDLFLGQLIRREGVAFAPLTSVFPSTTVNALTTANTGAQPIEHGDPRLYPLAERVRRGQRDDHVRAVRRERLVIRQAGVDPVAFQPVPSIFGRTREEAGVASYLVNAAKYHRSPLSLMQSTGATYVPYLGLSDGLAHIRRLVETPGDERMLIGAYYGQLDAIATSMAPARRSTPPRSRRSTRPCVARFSTRSIAPTPCS